MSNEEPSHRQGAQRADTGDVTLVLAKVARGDDSAVAELLPLVYEQLRKLARSYFRRQRPDHTLQPTALVHEAFLRMIGSDKTALSDRTHFFAVAATAMRQILIDHARRHGAAKRGGDRGRVSIESVETEVCVGGVDVLSLHEALERLAARSERQARIVELRVFGGLTCDQAARVLGFSPKTIEADWYLARAWLRRELAGLGTT